MDVLICVDMFNHACTHKHPHAQNLQIIVMPLFSLCGQSNYKGSFQAQNV